MKFVVFMLIKRDRFDLLGQKSVQIEVCRGQTETALNTERRKARSCPNAGLIF